MIMTNEDLELATSVFVQACGVLSAHGRSREEPVRLCNTSNTKEAARHYSCVEIHMAKAVQTSEQGAQAR